MKPGRTLGLSLAIIASVMLFTLIPLMQVALILIIRGRIAAVSLDVPGEAETAFPAMSGGVFEGVSDTGLIVQVVLGLVFLVIAYFAWRGRPGWIRLVMLGAVLALTVATVALSVASIMSSPDYTQGIDSGAALSQTLLSSRLLVSILVALYVVWYVNRAPARAFYRGYYLDKPETDAPRSAK